MARARSKWYSFAIKSRINIHQASWEELDAKSTKNVIFTAAHFLSAGRVPFYFCYVLCAVLGVFLLPAGNPYFFAFHLLDLVVRNALLKEVIRSVTVNIKSIILTVSLAPNSNTLLTQISCYSPPWYCTSTPSWDSCSSVKISFKTTS